MCDLEPPPSLVYSSLPSCFRMRPIQMPLGPLSPLFSSCSLLILWCTPKSVRKPLPVWCIFRGDPGRNDWQLMCEGEHWLLETGVDQCCPFWVLKLCIGAFLGPLRSKICSRFYIHREVQAVMCEMQIRIDLTRLIQPRLRHALPQLWSDGCCLNLGLLKPVVFTVSEPFAAVGVYCQQ